MAVDFMDRLDYYGIAAAFFTAMFGFFAVIIKEMRHTRFIIDQLRALQAEFNAHLKEHARKDNQRGIRRDR